MADDSNQNEKKWDLIIRTSSATTSTTYLWGARSNMEGILIDFPFCYLNRTRPYGYSKFMSSCSVSIIYSVFNIV